jgi:hypothetical protein
MLYRFNRKIKVNHPPRVNRKIGAEKMICIGLIFRNRGFTTIIAFGQSISLSQKTKLYKLSYDKSGL